MLVSFCLGECLHIFLSNSAKAHLHSPHRSADSTVDCINTEVGIFLSLQHKATVHCGIRTSVNEPQTVLICVLDLLRRESPAERLHQG